MSYSSFLNDVFTEGLRMMAQIAVIITIASGYAGVLTATGEIEPLVQASANIIGDNLHLGAAVMLIVGLFITIGFGDSFASVPILAPIYIPLAITLDFHHWLQLRYLVLRLHWAMRVHQPLP